MNKFKKSQSGLSLLELLFCIIILGIISGMVAPTFMGYAENAKGKSISAITDQVNNEILSLGQIHGVGPGAYNSKLVNSGNSYLDVLSSGYNFVADDYKLAYKNGPHSIIGGLVEIKSPSDGKAGEYGLKGGMTFKIGSNTEQNEYIIGNIDEGTITNFINDNAKSISSDFSSGNSGGNDKIKWTYNSGMYELTIIYPFVR